LGAGKEYLKAKALITHYALFAKNIGADSTQCGPSGEAELNGNDLIVSLGCGFTGPAGSAQEIRGTLMHELGHNFGLLHGGGDADNCKPNEISVMNYARQVPWTYLSATTTSGAPAEWVLTYSREKLPDLNENGGLSESAVLSITASQWSGTLPVGSSQFQMIIGNPGANPPVFEKSTGAPIDWNNAAGSVASQNINKISGMLGCDTGTTLSVLRSYDEWSLLNAAALNFRDGASIDGLIFPDPDTLSELIPAALEGVQGTLLTLNPIADVQAGVPITATGTLTTLSGTPIAGATITFTGSGAGNLVHATTDSNGRYTSTGNSPATAGTDWEVEAHYAGSASNPQANSDVQTFDTITLRVSGFYSPIDMNGVVNTVKSGKSVPLKFEVFNNANVEQTSTSVVLSFRQTKISCGTLQGNPTDAVEITTSGGTELRYDTVGGTFVQNWKTPSSQAGSCYSVTIAVAGANPITAYFKFT